MLRRRAKEFARPKSSIGSVKIEQFHGDRKKPFVQEGQLKRKPSSTNDVSLSQHAWGRSGRARPARAHGVHLCRRRCGAMETAGRKL